MSSGPSADPPRPADGPTAAEVAELRRGLEELSRNMETLREARSEPERRDARRQVRETEHDLDALARDAGVSRNALERAMQAARHEEEKERLRPILAELLAEQQNPPAGGDDDHQEEDDDDGGGQAKRPAARKPPRKTEKPTAPPPKEDDPPAPQPHWSDRKVNEMLR